ncbi:MAG: 23S rRNA pseudouridine(955/2504/2580) synthase [Gammaproteobacteria bacterium]|nr:23S rRNA pseudouridine(955/2504/2580) synthase [Gammaproteobacteria bacterium]RPG26380.1 MAG: RluA family pseudouridine synthase [Gammaproteobacteria bacterium TMED50]
MSAEQSQPVRIVTVDGDADGQRVDNFLMRWMKGVPRARLYRAIRKGEVRINGRRCRSNDRVRRDDQVRIPPVTVRTMSTAIATQDQMSAILGRIVHEDRGLLVINKPAGMAVHGGSGISLGLIELLRQARPEDRQLELVHRLDRGTSGCLMVSRRRSQLVALQNALRARSDIRKRYVALLHGPWPPSRQRVSLAMQKSSDESQRRLSRVTKSGKPAETRFQVIEQEGDYSLVNAWPVTGRTHQIRVHSAYLGHPVAGDDRYAERSQLNLDRQRGHSRLMLHARELKLSLPELHLDVHADSDIDFLNQ